MNQQNDNSKQQPSEDSHHGLDHSLRSGWTTGACATAATKAALTALITGTFPDPVGIILPKGDVPYFPLAYEGLGDGYAMAGIIKDAGDNPDITHGLTIISTVFPAPPGSGIIFQAGEGVGTINRHGLPMAPGEAAIHPAPRRLMREICEEICAQYELPADLVIIISVPGGEEIAKKTWSPRLGITGGISILGSTGIVHPFSCSPWIHSIHRGIDVARAEGKDHVLLTTDSTSETAAHALNDLRDCTILEVGDFIGSTLKYLRYHPIDKLTLVGDFAKFTKLAQGALDLHSAHSQDDMGFLWEQAHSIGVNENIKEQILSVNTALKAFELTQQHGFNLAQPIACKAFQTARKILNDAPIELEIIMTDRKGTILERL